MSKFVLVTEAPENLSEKEFVITEPTFIDEIRVAKNQPRPVALGKYHTSIAHLRSIAGVIGELYDPEEFNPHGSIPFNHFQGIEYADAEELSPIIIKMFTKFHPQIFFKYLDKQIKARPPQTELIYFVGSEENTEVFLSNGINRLDTASPVAESKKVTVKDEDVV